MAQLQHGDKYQVVWSNGKMVITWTDDTGLADETIFNIGVDPEASGCPSGAPDFDITADETITVTVPGSALTGGEDIEASSTFVVTADGATGLDMTIAMHHYTKNLRA